MNLKEIKELVDLITEKGISEFELERAGVRLKISRPTDGTSISGKGRGTPRIVGAPFGANPLLPA